MDLRPLRRNGKTRKEREEVSDKRPQEHSGTDNIVCPYCDYVHRDSWEIGSRDESGAMFCHGCNKAFLWSRYTQTTYSSKPPNTP